MDFIFSFVVGLLTAVLSLLGFVQQHPELPTESRIQAQQVAQQAITQATHVITKQNSIQIQPPSQVTGSAQATTSPPEPAKAEIDITTLQTHPVSGTFTGKLHKGESAENSVWIFFLNGTILGSNVLIGPYSEDLLTMFGVDPRVPLDHSWCGWDVRASVIIANPRIVPNSFDFIRGGERRTADFVRIISKSAPQQICPTE